MSKQKIQLSDHFDYSRLLRFVLPCIGTMLFTSIYGIVDGLCVSNFVGKTAFAAVLSGALAHLGGQVLAVEQLHLVPQLFFVVKRIQLGPVGGKEPEFYKMFVQDPISSDAFRR